MLRLLASAIVASRVLALATVTAAWQPFVVELGSERKAGHTTAAQPQHYTIHSKRFELDG